MKKEDIAVVAQLLSGMKDSIKKIESAKKNKDLELLNTSKKEMILFQKKINDLL